MLMAQKHVSLGFIKHSDTRKPIGVRLIIQDADWNVETIIDLDEHQFTALLSGQVISETEL